MNSATLKLLNIPIASVVRLTYGENTTYGTVWQSSSIPLDHVSLYPTKTRSLGVSIGKHIIVQHMEVPVVVAESVS